MKRLLYLGTDPSHYPYEGELVHLPLIKIVPCLKAQESFQEMDGFTHLIFTSKNGVEVFFSLFKGELKNKILGAVGKVTALYLEKHGYPPQLVAGEETQEGLIELLKKEKLENSNLLLPGSSRSRPLLQRFLQEKGIRYKAVALYHTELIKPQELPNLESFNEIIFTSPSTVEAFFQIFSTIPKGIKLTPIGPVTQISLNNFLK